MQAVVYDPLPGATHLLDPVATAVLGHLRARNSSAVTIARALRRDFDTDSEEDVLAAVEAALAQLQTLGLVHATDT